MSRHPSPGQAVTRVYGAARPGVAGPAPSTAEASWDANSPGLKLAGVQAVKTVANTAATTSVTPRLRITWRAGGVPEIRPSSKCESVIAQSCYTHVGRFSSRTLGCDLLRRSNVLTSF